MHCILTHDKNSKIKISHPRSNAMYSIMKLSSGAEKTTPAIREYNPIGLLIFTITNDTIQLSLIAVTVSNAAVLKNRQKK